VDAVVRALQQVLDPDTNARMAAASRHRAETVFDYDLLATTLQGALRHA
jgi:hypothetical protein